MAMLKQVINKTAGVRRPPDTSRFIDYLFKHSHIVIGIFIWLPVGESSANEWSADKFFTADTNSFSIKMSPLPIWSRE